MKLFPVFAAAAGVLLLGSCASSPKVPANIPYDYTEQNITIMNSGRGVPGIVTLPRGGGGEQFPAVVMLHGYGSDKNEAGNGYKLFAPELAKNGIASIRIDFIGTGDSTVDHIYFNYDTAVSDADAAAAYIAGLPEIDAKRIGVLGWSQGGTIAMLSAGRNRIYKSAVTWAGAPESAKFVSDEETYAIAKRDGYAVAEFNWRTPLKLGIDAFEIARKTDVLGELSKSKAPILAITGSNDTSVLPENVYRIAEASSNRKSETLVIHDADHTFNIFSGNMKAFTILTDATLNWFKATL
ncbi:alpha/beta hydrolase family protein [Breznakiella homolactica]|uniref:Alpha/beta fold hydrolase n=1 Tax=Breznakiella homolactica TaxID=2798577 RepID=A0A7T8BCY8_9SPIR|nr:alpha/beta fold hydrolase [Breznakiella homolactica]QQO10728.1 alpha/beta fold hydrolase [Breznakiella homolactica]